MADTHVTITGNLTADPELRFTPSGLQVANLRLAVTPRVRDGDTWRDGETHFFRVNVWRDQAEHVVLALFRTARKSFPWREGPSMQLRKRTSGLGHRWSGWAQLALTTR